MTIRICGDEWMDIKKLGEICTIVSGGTPSRTNTEFWDGGAIPWIKIGDVKEKHVSKADEYITQAGLDGSSAKMLSKGTILYTIFATLGEAGILTIDACTNQAIAGITIKNQDEVLADYLYYYLKSKKSYVNNLGRGVAQNNINLSILRNLEVPLPALPTQRQTVDILDKNAKVIEYRQQQLQKLDDLVKAQFVELFGDPELNPRDLPVLPWDAVFLTTTGKLDSNAMVENGRYPFFTCAKESHRIDSYAFDCEALLLAGNNAAGIYDVKHYKGKFNVYQRTYVLRLMNERWSYTLFKRQLEDKLRYLQNQSKGTNTRYLTLGILNELRFVVPPVAEQEQFAAFVAQTDKLKAVIQKALDEAQLLFDSLMQKYFG